MSLPESEKHMKLQHVRGQRDASGYDFWYQGVDDKGNEVLVSATQMHKWGHLLDDPMDAQEWREWLSIQNPYTPRKPSPRKLLPERERQ